MALLADVGGVVAEGAVADTAEVALALHWRVAGYTELAVVVGVAEETVGEVAEEAGGGIGGE